MFSKIVIKLGNKAFYLIGGIVVVVFAIIMVVMFVNTEAKTPATCEQVSKELINLGYEYNDCTDHYKGQSANLDGAIMSDNGKVNFYFFELDNDKSALNLFRNCQAQINEKRLYGVQEWEEHYNNYTMYATQSDGVYYTIIRVGNTVIDAQCDAEYTSELGEILTAIGYQDA